LKIKVTAGTHIGIVGCYGERNITIKGDNPEQEVKDFVFNEFEKEITSCRGWYEWKREPGWFLNPVYSFLGPGGYTLIEYYFETI